MPLRRRMQLKILYVVPITSILGRLALFPVGDTGTIPFTMRKESKDFDGASCDTKMGAGDGSRCHSLVVHEQCCHEVGNKPINCLSSNCKFKFYT
jgi:hypothetical protein